MLRYTSRRLVLDKLGNTKLGAEVLAETRREMQSIESKDNFVVRFLTRRRPVDHLAIEVDGPITKEFNAYFVYAKHLSTALLCLPVFALSLSGVLSPTFYLLVSTNIMPADKYYKMWAHGNRLVELAGQAVFCVVFYDLSAYIRYPFFARVLAPVFRRQGWLRPLPKANFSADELRRGAAMRGGKGTKPLGRPLGQVRREFKAEAKPNPFGRASSTKVVPAPKSGGH